MTAGQGRQRLAPLLLFGHTGELARAEARNTFVRRHPEDKVLHQLVREYLETFLAEARARNGGDGLPRFVERELREFLSCGVLACGFARFRCEACGLEILLAYSCKGRGFYPACGGRRMAELAAHLTDGVLGGLPARRPRSPATGRSAMPGPPFWNGRLPSTFLHVPNAVAGYDSWRRSSSDR